MVVLVLFGVGFQVDIADGLAERDQGPGGRSGGGVVQKIDYSEREGGVISGGGLVVVRGRSSLYIPQISA